VLGWAGAFVGVLALAAGGYSLYEYRTISSNIKRVDVLATDDPSIRNPQAQLNAENFLLIGSDTRAGADARYGGTAVEGHRSDTTILAHLSPDRQHATLVSFPRDAWVTIPSCEGANGQAIAERQGMFNTAFETGGPQCTIRTLQKLTGIEIRHYVQVDFSGFKTMVDALGGVPICSTANVYDPDSGLRLHRGVQTLLGEQALALVRARHNLGDGSDLDRIRRQQQFLAAMIRVATGSGVLLNPVRLTHVLDATSRAVTLDRQTSLSDLQGLASQLHGLDPRRVTFLTAPIADRDYDPTGQRRTGGGRVLLDAARGELLWQSMITDRPPGRAAPSGPPVAGPTGGPTGGRTAGAVTVPPRQVTVQVRNGVGSTGLAHEVAAALAGQGFTTVLPTNDAPGATASIIRYAPEARDAALTLAAAVPGAVLAEDATLGRTLQLVVGSSYHGVRAVRLGQPVPAPPGSSRGRDGAGGSAASAAEPSPQRPISAADTGCV
jgi:LCP family protein required for cell wall assembly